MARYTKDHKGHTRRRIVELASKRFRADGIDGVGIASLMAEAGLTNGGFYAHFASKEDLIKEAMVHALSEMPGRDVAVGAHDVRAFIELYLSRHHCDNAATGCAVAALSPELMRRPAESRTAIQKESASIIESIAAGLPDNVAAADRIPCALAVMSHLIGTLQMARFTTNAAASDAILARGRAEALRIAGFDQQGADHGPTRTGTSKSLSEANKS